MARSLKLMTMVTFVMVLLLSTATSAFATANVRIMPDRDALSGTPIVVWGNTNFANGTPFSMNFGDGSPVISGNVGDRTYIAFTKAYATGVYTAKLTVDGENETATITVFNPGALTPDNLRAIKINMAIEDGLRWLYVNQVNRATTYLTKFTSWSGAGADSSTMSYSSLAILALENHGHHVTDDPNKDIYQTVVQRGLNFLFNGMIKIGLTNQPAGNPCGVGLGAVPDPCQGLGTTGTNGYATAVMALAIAGSNDMPRTVGAGIGAFNGNYVVGRTYGEILQRIVNTIAWGQSDPAFGPGNQGGWRYGLNQDSDASAIGWNVLALLDAKAVGRTIPSFVASELNVVTTNTTVTPVAGQSSLKYATGWTRGSLMRAGVRLQALFFMGVPVGDARVAASRDYINAAWNAFHPNGEEFSCPGPSGLGPGSPPASANNRGCAYSMFQVFKGLKLYGISTLPNVLTRPDKDWHKQYQDYLIANQQIPTSPGGGQWGPGQMWWSCCDTNVVGITALAELMLSPTALVLPSSLSLTPLTATNLFGQNHTVTAKATTAGGGVVPGATVTFTVISGPKAGTTGTGTTNAQGEATFTYTNNGPNAGTDTIRASIGAVQSNTVTKEWKSPNNPPIANAGADISVAAGANCLGTATLNGTGSSDPDPGDTITFSWSGPGAISGGNTATPTVSGLALGTHTFTLTVTDSKGATSTDTVLVKVEDKTPPTLTVTPPQTVEQKSLGGTTLTLTATATDNCGPVTVSPATVTQLFPLGTTTVIFTATDGAGNSATASTTVTVVDTTPPALTAPPDVTVEQTNKAGTPATIGSATVSDICDANPAVTNNAPATFPLGTTVVTFTAKDASGNTSTATMKVTVVDTTPPKLTPPADIKAEQTNRAGTPVTIPSATVSDICDANPTVTNNAPAVFPLGTTVVTFTAKDASGNISTATMNVTIVDTTAPTVTGALTATTLWPPNHDIVPIGNISTADICDAAPKITVSITQDEPLNTTGDGNFQPDASVGFNGSTASFGLRRERRGNEDGRVYLIKFTSTDASGNTKYTCSAVTVTQSQNSRDQASVAAQAAAAVNACNATGAVLPYSSTGGPVVGPKQ